jgi:hypothetical protein
LYWVYIALFVAIVLVPVFVHEGRLLAVKNQQIAEVILIFIFGTLAWFLYYWKYSQAARLQKKNNELQKEALNASKDLSSTYHYIGQINRKLDILRSIVLGLPSSTDISSKKQDYVSIMEAIEMFSGCKQYLIGFYDHKTGKVLKEIKAGSEFNPDIERKDCFKDQSTVLKFDDFYFLRTKQRVYHMCAYAILDKKSLRNQDIDLIKSLLAQALFLFIYTKEKEKMEEHHNSFWRQ